MTDKDYERAWCGANERLVNHFYHLGGGLFAFGYKKPEGEYLCGVTQLTAGSFKDTVFFVATQPVATTPW